LTILVPTVRTDARCRQILSGLAALADAHAGEIKVIVSDNSQDRSKQEFLNSLQQRRSAVLEVHLHPQRLTAMENVFFLHQQATSEILMHHSDDDFVSYDFIRSAHQALIQRGDLSAGHGTYIIFRRPFGYLIHPEKPASWDGNLADQRIAGYYQRWQQFNVLFYSVFRKHCVGGALEYLRQHPLHAPFHDFWFTYGMLGAGKAVDTQDGYMVYDGNNQYGNGAASTLAHYAAAGAARELGYLQDLHWAVEAVCFLLSRYSPVADPVQRRACARMLFNHHIQSFSEPLRRIGLERSILPEILRPIVDKHVLSPRERTWEGAANAIIEAVTVHDPDTAARYYRFLDSMISGAELTS